MANKYTMSPAALKQRRQAAKKLKTEGRMTAVKVSQRNSDWARAEFGTVNRALNYIRGASAPRFN
jgi:hypothetical protein